jgi:hypothetical protein
MNAVARSWRAALTCLALVGSLTTGAFAASEPVDVELVLAVDVSSSMNEEELRLQREGYAAAFRSKDVIEAITGGLHRKVAITYVEWGGEASQYVIVPWTVIGSADDAYRVSDRLLAAEIGKSRYLTSIAGAIRYGQRAIRNNRFSSGRRVIDISGDGPNNQGGLVTRARDAAVADGVTINGLPLMVPGNVLKGNTPSLDTYYVDCVIGGSQSFLLPVRSWDQFPDAVRRKLVLELAGGRGMDVVPAAPAVRLWRVSANGTDCSIGEKLWRGW